MNYSHFCLLASRFVFRFDGSTNLEREPAPAPEHELSTEKKEA